MGGPKWPQATEQLLRMEFAAPDWPVHQNTITGLMIEENRFNIDSDDDSEHGPYGTPRRSPDKNMMGEFLVPEKSQAWPTDTVVEVRQDPKVPTLPKPTVSFQELGAGRGASVSDLPVVPETSAASWKNGALVLEQD